MSILGDTLRGFGDMVEDAASMLGHDPIKGGVTTEEAENMLERDAFDRDYSAQEMADHLGVPVEEVLEADPYDPRWQEAWKNP
jgi:hypothetical protein